MLAGRADPPNKQRERDSESDNQEDTTDDTSLVCKALFFTISLFRFSTNTLCDVVCHVPVQIEITKFVDAGGRTWNLECTPLKSNKTDQKQPFTNTFRLQQTVQLEFNTRDCGLCQVSDLARNFSLALPLRTLVFPLRSGSALAEISWK